MKKSFQKGFTLIEILLVIGIIAVLAAVVVVSLNPVQRFQDAEYSRRLSDIPSILSATSQYVIDNQGAFPPGVSTSEMQIGTASTGCALTYDSCSANITYCLDLATPLAPYLKDIPYDPETGSDAKTHYTIKTDSNNIVTVTACDANDATLSQVSR